MRSKILPLNRRRYTAYLHVGGSQHYFLFAFFVFFHCVVGTFECLYQWEWEWGRLCATLLHRELTHCVDLGWFALPRWKLCGGGGVSRLRTPTSKGGRGRKKGRREKKMNKTPLCDSCVKPRLLYQPPVTYLTWKLCPPTPPPPTHTPSHTLFAPWRRVVKISTETVWFFFFITIIIINFEEA